MRIAIQNFKAIERAQVEPEGITLVTGDNSAGKSTLLKALKSLLSNNLPPSCCRHGSKGFSICLDLQDHSLTASRQLTSPLVLTYDNQTYGKVGKSSIAELFPSFPLRRYDWQGSKFYPQFIFQNRYPLLDDIPVYDLLSLLFDKVAFVSSRLSEISKDLAASQKTLSNQTRVVEVLQKSQAAAALNLSDFERKHDLTRLLPLAERKEALQDKLTKCEARIGVLEAEVLSAPSLCPVLMRNIKELESLRPSYDLALALSGKLDRLAALGKSIQALQERRKALSGLLSRMTGFDRLHGHITRLRALNSSIALLRRRKSETEEGIAALKRSLPSISCDLHNRGLCPYYSKEAAHEPR